MWDPDGGLCWARVPWDRLGSARVPVPPQAPQGFGLWVVLMSRQDRRSRKQETAGPLCANEAVMPRGAGRQWLDKHGSGHVPRAQEPPAGIGEQEVRPSLTADSLRPGCPSF